MAQEIKVPDIGDFEAVEIIEVLVAAGDAIEEEQALITLESDKATLEVPSTLTGTITEMKVAEGDQVSEGDVIALVEVAASEPAAPAEESAADDAPAPEPAASQPAKQQPSPAGEPAAGEEHGYDCDVLVLGSGPGGYTAAFRAADLGLDVVLVERHSALGGVCLNVGCIPSKALLHSAKVIDDAAAMAAHGLKFGQPEIDLPALLKFKQSTIDTLTGGLAGMAKKRKVRVVTGTGRFKDAHTL